MNYTKVYFWFISQHILSKKIQGQSLQLEKVSTIWYTSEYLVIIGTVQTWPSLSSANSIILEHL